MSVIFIECGTSMHSVYSTGIQRVVRNIVRESAIVGPMLDHQCIPVQFIAGQFQQFEPPQASQMVPKKTWKFRIYSMVRTIYRSIKHWIPASIKNYIQDAMRGGAGLNRIKIALGVIPNAPPSIKDLVAKNQNNDGTEGVRNEMPVLLLLDSSWNMKFWPAVDQFRADGGRACAVLYDLIPFTHPDTVEEHTRNAHTDWWREAPKHLDSVICISKTVRNQYLDWQHQNSLSNQLTEEQVGYFYLGSELKGVETTQTSEECPVSVQDPFFLVVGSIEPRKNHALILKAFEELWRKNVPVNLVIVGSHGWKSESLIARIQAHPQFNKSLYLLRNTSDAELDALYGRTKGLVIASVAEGFGLPIVEAFQRGASVICSDIPVFREIGGEDASYFSPENYVELESIVHSIVDNPDLHVRAERPSVSWITWQESAKSLIQQIDKSLLNDSRLVECNL